MMVTHQHLPPENTLRTPEINQCSILSRNLEQQRHPVDCGRHDLRGRILLLRKSVIWFRTKVAVSHTNTGARVWICLFVCLRWIGLVNISDSLLTIAKHESQFLCLSVGPVRKQHLNVTLTRNTVICFYSHSNSTIGSS